MDEQNNEQYIGEEVHDIPLLVSNLCEEKTEEVDYYLVMLEEILKYPFWKSTSVEKRGKYLVFIMNEGTTEIRIQYVSNINLQSHIVYLLHQSITGYIKKRKVIRARTKPDILAKRNTLIIEIKPVQRK